MDNLEYCKNIARELDAIANNETGITIYDYMEECLDVCFIITSRNQYKAVRAAVTLGGPNVYINTEDKMVELFWCGERAAYPLSDSVIDMLDAWGEEYFNFMR